MTLHKKYKINENGKDYVIGDLHGCYDLLADKMYEIGFNKKVDRLFSVGDLIDRGSKSLECLRLATEDWFFPVQGNHEDMMLSAVLDGKNVDLWLVNGGDWYIKLALDEQLIVKELCQIIRETMPYSITVETENGDIGICHAQPPSIDWKNAVKPDERDIKIMLWSRSWIADGKQDRVDFIYKTYHGHTPKEVVTIANTNFIDTGAFFTGKLTMAELK